MEQKYEYVPAFVKVNENLSSVSSALDLNTLGSSELTTVCGISSRLIHVTVVPAATVKVAGKKLKLSILTSKVCSWPCCIVEPKYPEPAANKAKALKSENVNAVMHKHVRIISFISLFLFECSYLSARHALRRQAGLTDLNVTGAPASVRLPLRTTPRFETRGVTSNRRTVAAPKCEGLIGRIPAL